ncbi:MAG TPA: 4-(cytidine 5'-diphospho)-2-C-methyl-D-erythritol kinase [Aestuariivirga sp.]|nr:4-(cytidine 5'-diphospho)-2-C-methyl-D-erythritol kinase [Aestuariivirga sp.]
MVAPLSLTTRAKVNLALQVLGRRADGYHELDSIVAFAAVGDRLDFTLARDFTLSVQGPFAAGLSGHDNIIDNIIARAHDAARDLTARHGRKLPGVAVALTKNLPVASGIGGGSGDAAAALRGFLHLAGLAADHPALREDVARAALALGADVPVCLRDRACRMTGIGETISPLTMSLPPAIVLANPMQPLATAAVFQALGLAPGQTGAGAIAAEDPAHWRNDLEAPACTVVPVIAEVLASLRQAGDFSRVAMSGSGATCFGLAPSLAAAEQAASRLRHSHPQWWVAAATLA